MGRPCWRESGQGTTFHQCRAARSSRLRFNAPARCASTVKNELGFELTECEPGGCAQTLKLSIRVRPLPLGFSLTGRRTSQRCGVEQPRLHLTTSGIGKNKSDHCDLAVRKEDRCVTNESR